MIFIDEDGSYLYSYMHKDGTKVQSNGRWEFYIDDRKTARMTFYNSRIVRGYNIIPDEHILGTFLKRNIWGKLIISLNYDEGMLLVKQRGYEWE